MVEYINKLTREGRGGSPSHQPSPTRSSGKKGAVGVPPTNPPLLGRVGRRARWESLPPTLPYSVEWEEGRGGSPSHQPSPTRSSGKKGAVGVPPTNPPLLGRVGRRARWESLPPTLPYSVEWEEGRGGSPSHQPSPTRSSGKKGAVGVPPTNPPLLGRVGRRVRWESLPPTLPYSVEWEEGRGGSPSHQPSPTRSSGKKGAVGVPPTNPPLLGRVGRRARWESLPPTLPYSVEWEEGRGGSPSHQPSPTRSSGKKGAVGVPPTNPPLLGRVGRRVRWESLPPTLPYSVEWEEGCGGSPSHQPSPTRSSGKKGAVGVPPTNPPLLGRVGRRVRWESLPPTLPYSVEWEEGCGGSPSHQPSPTRSSGKKGAVGVPPTNPPLLGRVGRRARWESLPPTLPYSVEWEEGCGGSPSHQPSPTRSSGKKGAVGVPPTNPPLLGRVGRRARWESLPPTLPYSVEWEEGCGGSPSHQPSPTRSSGKKGAVGVPPTNPPLLGRVGRRARWESLPPTLPYSVEWEEGRGGSPSHQPSPTRSSGKKGARWEVPPTNPPLLGRVGRRVRWESLPPTLPYSVEWEEGCGGSPSHQPSPTRSSGKKGAVGVPPTNPPLLGRVGRRVRWESLPPTLPYSVEWEEGCGGSPSHQPSPTRSSGKKGAVGVPPTNPPLLGRVGRRVRWESLPPTLPYSVEWEEGCGGSPSHQPSPTRSSGKKGAVGVPPTNPPLLGRVGRRARWESLPPTLPYSVEWEEGCGGSPSHQPSPTRSSGKKGAVGVPPTNPPLLGRVGRRARWESLPPTLPYSVEWEEGCGGSPSHQPSPTRSSGKKGAVGVPPTNPPLLGRVGRRVRWESLPPTLPYSVEWEEGCGGSPSHQPSPTRSSGKKGAVGVPPTNPPLLGRVGRRVRWESLPPTLPYSVEWEEGQWESLPPTLPYSVEWEEGCGGSPSHQPSPTRSSGKKGAVGVPPTNPPLLGRVGRRVRWESLPPTLPYSVEWEEGCGGSPSHQPSPTRSSGKKGAVGVPPTNPPLLGRVGRRVGGSPSHQPSPTRSSGKKGAVGVPPTNPPLLGRVGRRVRWESLPPTLPYSVEWEEGCGGSPSHQPSPTRSSGKKGAVGVPPLLGRVGRRVRWESLPPTLPYSPTPTFSRHTRFI